MATRTASTWRAARSLPATLVVRSLAAVSAVAALLGRPRPVGVAPLDAAWTVAVAVAVVYVGSRSRRLPTVWLAGVAGVVGVGGSGAGIAFGVLSLVAGALVAYSRYRDRMAGALAAALALQALLHGSAPGPPWVGPALGLAAIAPATVSAWRMSRRRERRTATWVLALVGGVVGVGLATAGVAAMRARAHVERATDQAELALDLLRTGDVRGATGAFESARIGFDQASDTFAGPLGLTGRVVPVVAQHLEAARRATEAGERLSTTATRVATAADWGTISATDGTIDLDLVRGAQQPVADSADALADALSTLDDVRSPWLVPALDHELGRFDVQLEEVTSQAALASAGLEVAPALLGAEGPRRYLVAFGTPGESRHGGGYVGAFAVVDADDGTLEMVRNGPIGDIQPEGAPLELSLPDGWTDAYGGYEVGAFPGNLSASPDWPTDAAVAAQVYDQAPGGGPVDGVLYVDPAALAALLELTGPVTVEGVDRPLDASNAERYLLVDQYVQFDGAVGERREVLGNVARAVFDALSSRPLPGIRALAQVLGGTVAEGHLRLTSLAGGPEQAFLEDVGIGGRFEARPGADLLSVRSANGVSSKIDAFLSRDITATVDLDPRSGRVTTTVRVVLANAATDPQLPDYVVGDGFQVPRLDNLDLLTVFSPHQLTRVVVDNEPAPVQVHEHDGVNAYTVPVVVPGGGSSVVTFALQGVVAPSPDGELAYDLDVLPQALANADSWTVVVLDRGDEVRRTSGRSTGALQISADPADDR